MTVTSALAVVPSRDLQAARRWWIQLLGRDADRVPMPSDLEWHFAQGGGLQVVDDAERAGAGSVTLGVDDVDAELAAARSRGLDVPRAETVPSGQFRMALLHDRDGNTVVLAQDLTGQVAGAGVTALVVAGRLHVAAERRDEYLATCADVVAQARSADGCLDFAIGADLVDPTRVNVYERWVSRAAVERFRGDGVGDDQTSMIVDAEVTEYKVTSDRALT